jgi:hypothetical protein
MTAEVLEGPVNDLNVMTRRGRFRAKVERLATANEIEITLTGTTIVFAHPSSIEVAFADLHCSLGIGDAVCFNERGVASVHGYGEASFLVAHIEKGDVGGALA